MATRLSLTFLGAAGTVTGSKYLITAGERRILVDAGLFQGEKEWRRRNWEPFPVDPATISDVILTHAHLDHSGYLPVLVAHGFGGRIHCTDGTRRLAEIVLRDAGHLQEQDAEHAAQRGYSKHDPPRALYGPADVEATLPLLAPCRYDESVPLGEGLTFEMVRAGHILGSATVTVSLDGHPLVVFSGDLGRVDHPVLRARQVPAGAEYVVVESTYGDREHAEPAGEPHELLADTIRRTIGRGGSVLIPAFAVDRTEVVLKALSDLRAAERIPDVPVFVNSPMALSALEVYRSAPSSELRAGLRAEGFVDLPNLHEARTKEQSMALNSPRRPCVIISSSGMATGGRVLHHLERMLPDARNSVVLTGYQAAGTRGRSLAEGARAIKLHGGYVPVNAEIVADPEFSVHADASELVDWLRDLRPAPRTVFVAHGENEAAATLATRIRAELGWVAVVPAYGEVVRLIAP